MEFKSENHRSHYLGWMWFYRHPWERNKLKNPILKKAVHSHCYACDEADDRGTAYRCDSCPIKWDNIWNRCEYFGEYTNWLYAESDSERAKAAKIIAELEWHDSN